MTMAPENMDASTFEATTARCLECGNESDPEATECEHCDDSVMEYYHVTTEPKGFEDDDEFLIAGRNGGADRWEYYAMDPGA